MIGSVCMLDTAYSFFLAIGKRGQNFQVRISVEGPPKSRV